MVSNLVDIFEIAPQELQQAQPAVLSGQDARLSRYQIILSKLYTNDDIAGGTTLGHLDWLSDDDTMEIRTGPPSVKEGGGEPLVGTFADAAAAAAAAAAA